MEAARWRERTKFKNRWGDPGAPCRLGSGGMDEEPPHGSKKQRLQSSLWGLETAWEGPTLGWMP